VCRYDCTTAADSSAVAHRRGERTSDESGNATSDHAGCRPFRARHRQRQSPRVHWRTLPASMSIPGVAGRHAVTPSERVPTSTRSASPPGNADPGHRTRSTAVTGPHVRRLHQVSIPPRVCQHTSARAARSSSPGRNRTVDLGIQSPASLASGDSGAALGSAAATDGERDTSSWASTQRGRGRTLTPLRVRAEVTVPRAPSSCNSPDRETLVAGWMQAAGPCSPAPAGSPRWGRVMRAVMSGQRRTGAGHRNWPRPGSSGPDRVCPHAGRVGARRSCPRLWTSERAVGCGELSSY
jgi:hypothetical protein